MKSFVQRILQAILGYNSYLWIFARYKLLVLHKDQSEKDFFYFLNMIKPKSLVLDIGANLGLMSYYLCKAGHEVHAFEPIPSNIKVLKRIKSTFHLANLHIHELALGESEGEIELILPIVDGVIKQGLSHVKADKMTDFNQGKTITCPIKRLDSLREFGSGKLEAIKIDVENFEFEVFKGAIQLLKEHKPMIYCELWDNQNRKDCFELLTELGYEIKVLEHNTLIHFNRNQSNTQNFFFIHPQA